METRAVDHTCDGKISLLILHIWLFEDLRKFRSEIADKEEMVQIKYRLAK